MAAWWAVARMSLEAAVRSVRGVPSEAAAAKAAVMPGTISKGMLRGAEGGDLLAGAAEDEGVAGLEAEDGIAGACSIEHEGVDLGLGDARLPAALADGEGAGGGVGEGEDSGGDEVVGEDEGGGGEEAGGAEGEEVGVAGAGADEVDVTGLGCGTRRSRFLLGSSGGWGWAGWGWCRAWRRARVREGQAS